MSASHVSRGSEMPNFSRDTDGPGTCSGGRSHPNHGSRHSGRFPRSISCHPEPCLPRYLFGSNAVVAHRCSELDRSLIMFYSLFLSTDRPFSTAPSLGPSTGSWMRWPRSDLVPPMPDGALCWRRERARLLSLSLPVQPPSSLSSPSAS